MDYALLECEPHMVDVIDQLLPAGIERFADDTQPLDGMHVTIVGDALLIPATVVRLHTTLSKSGKRRSKLVPA